MDPADITLSRNEMSELRFAMDKLKLHLSYFHYFNKRLGAIASFEETLKNNPGFLKVPGVASLVSGMDTLKTAMLASLGSSSAVQPASTPSSHLPVFPAY